MKNYVKHLHILDFVKMMQKYYYFYWRKKAITIDVERAVFLRQPEVSVGLKNLRKLGLVKKQDIPRESKGRPIHEYSLNQSKQMFLKKHIEKEVDTQKKIL